jgi:1-acyl-sn-glycerol-3-phosphate acyltransferase
MRYKLAKLIIGLALRIYYKRIDIRGLEHLNASGPSIIIANHPNTLVDALLIAYVSKQPIYFLAKATLFNSKWKLRFLQRWNMIPINRPGEGAVYGVRNLESFSACFKILEKGRRILIFPEGSSYKERVLRQLKTGAARIALDFEKKHQGQSGLKVIPIGINYSDQERFQSSILVSIGQPIFVADFLESYQRDLVQTSRDLTQTFRECLENLLITAYDQQEDKLFELLRVSLSSKYLMKPKDDFKFLQELKIALTKIRVNDPSKYQELIKLTNEIRWKSEKLAIRMDFSDRRFKSMMFLRQIIFSIIGLFVIFPVFVYGIIHNGFQFKLTDILISKLTKEVEYYAPMAILMGILIYPLSYLGFIILLHQFVHIPWWGKLAYYSSLPLSGIVAYYIFKYYKHVSFKWNYFLMMFNKKETLLEIKEKRNILRQLLFDKS